KAPMTTELPSYTTSRDVTQARDIPFTEATYNWERGIALSDRKGITRSPFLREVLHRMCMDPGTKGGVYLRMRPWDRMRFQRPAGAVHHHPSCPVGSRERMSRKSEYSYTSRPWRRRDDA